MLLYLRNQGPKTQCGPAEEIRYGSEGRRMTTGIPSTVDQAKDWACSLESIRLIVEASPGD
jgi:hypothetical protein